MPEFEDSAACFSTRPEEDLQAFVLAQSEVAFGPLVASFLSGFASSASVEVAVVVVAAVALAAAVACPSSRTLVSEDSLGPEASWQLSEQQHVVAVAVPAKSRCCLDPRARPQPSASSDVGVADDVAAGFDHWRSSDRRLD